MQPRSLGTLVTFNPMFVRPQTSLPEIVRLLDQCEIRHVPVVDEAFCLLGIVSDVDLTATLQFEPALASQAASDGPTLVDALPTAADLMTRHLVTIDRNDRPLDALEALLRFGFHSVPVVDGPRLLGIITSSDFLREMAYGTSAAASLPLVRVVQRDCLCVEADAEPAAVACRMESQGRRHVAVTADGRPLGVLALYQLRRRQRIEWLVDDPWAPALTPLVRPLDHVGELLPNRSFSVGPQDTLAAAAALIAQHRLPGLPVLDDNQQLLGIVTEGELLAALAAELREH